MMQPTNFVKQLQLQFDAKYGTEEPTYVNLKKKPVTRQLSAAVFTDNGKYLWLAADEEIAIECLEKDTKDENIYKQHQRFALKDLLEGFDPDKKEVDIEGLDFDGQYLWLIGSHSSKRKKAENNPLEDDELTIEKEENRYLLARIPLVDGKLLKSTDSLHSAVLKRGDKTNELMQALATDSYLSKILSIDLPGKDNGFDIEGFVIQNNKVLIGLRGPVLRGIAIIVEIELFETEEQGQLTGILDLKTIGTNGNRYQLHFVDVDGLGIRELCFDHNTLLILAGPTMDLDASLKLFRLHDPFALPENSLTEQGKDQLEFLFEIPHQPRTDKEKGGDKAEGIAIYPNATQDNSILVVYDTPHEKRHFDEEKLTVSADLFRLEKIE